MRYPSFLLYNALGGITWAVVFGLAGYAFGKNIGFLEECIRDIGWGALAVFAVALLSYLLWKNAGGSGKKTPK